MSQPVTSPDPSVEDVTTCHKVLSMEPEAVRQRVHREKVKQAENRIAELEAELTVLRSSHEAFKVAVEEFTQLKTALESERVSIEAERVAMQSLSEAVGLGQKVLADNALKYLVTKMYLVSEPQRNKLQDLARAYRQSTGIK